MTSKIPSEILPGFNIKPDYCPHAGNIMHSCQGCNQYIIKTKCASCICQ